MNCWEYKYIQEFQRAGKLITEQQTYDFNPLLAITTKRKEAAERTSHTSTVQQQPDYGEHATTSTQSTSITTKKIQTGDLNSI